MNRALKLTVRLASSCLLASMANAAATNLAQGKPASAASSWSGGSDQYSIANGNDGNLYNFWNGGTWASWWEVDLRSLSWIDHVTVYGSDGSGYHTTFQLSSSVDGSFWTKIGEQTTASGPEWSLTFDTPGRAMRYIRYTTISEAGSDWASLSELQAIGVVPEPAAFGLLAAGLVVLGIATRRRRMA